MEGKANNLHQVRPLTKESSVLPSSTASSGSNSPPHFLRHVQAAFKRHRSLGTMQSNVVRARRTLVPQRETSKGSMLTMDPQINGNKSQDDVLLSQKLQDCMAQPKSMISVAGETQEASITQSSEWGSTINTQDGSFRSVNPQGGQLRAFSVSRSSDTVASAVVESEHIPREEGQKKVNFQTENDANSQDTGWNTSNEGAVTTALSQDLKHQVIQSAEVGGSLRAEGVVSSSTARTMGFSSQLNHFTNFLQNDLSQPNAPSSVVGLSCATTTLVNSTSAPMYSSTTYCSQPQLTSSSHLGVDSMVEAEMNSRPFPCKDLGQLPNLPSNYNGGMPSNQADIPIQTSSSPAGNNMDIQKVDHCNFPHESAPKDFNTSKDECPDDSSTKKNVTDKQAQASSGAPSSDMKSERAKEVKQEKGATGKAATSSRKKNYDPDLFFKVNGKLYQRLGKIGSGGSSEVHKVISSDCKIYALKKIKLKGRDYATAYGFYQEIEYLNKLKGMSNIIQLIDYEVTDKTFLHEVINGSISNKDARVKEDGYIYMVLEYGEIDLAHMLSQKWKELDDTNTTIDENWLRFYWQQILLAVNTIHDERIVHSDLKPANFLLVRGSLKLIDFGIAKAIMSDTTNIQRDSQVGTLSYMSPEAFMCNETDENGNTIKCGRPSDIWSLGCILYQMVYGQTPFSDYKTFWAKFKVITDPNHEIMYEPVSNPWLLDIMKKCLAWDRNKRWRIPQLLQHPFLVPPVPSQISTPQDQSSQLLHFIAASCQNDQRALMLCSQLQELLSGPRSSTQSDALSSSYEQCKMLSKMSNICNQLQECLAKSGRHMAD